MKSLLPVTTEVRRVNPALLSGDPKRIAAFADKMIRREEQGIFVTTNWPRGHLTQYYFNLRRHGLTPREARNCTVTVASAKDVIYGPENAHLAEFYSRSGCYQGD